jgi:hypothetical protein
MLRKNISEGSDASATNATSNATANAEVGIDVSNKDNPIQYTTNSGNSSDKK